MQIDRKENRLLAIATKVAEKSFGVALLAGLLGQCTSNAKLQSSVQALAERNVIVQVGQGREMLIGRQISDKENRELFIAETIASFSWIKQTSPEYQATCKAIAKERGNLVLFKQCKSGIDPGAMTRYGKFPSQIFAYQDIIAPEALKEMLPFLYSFKPPGFDSPQFTGSRTMQVERLGEAEPFMNGKEMRTPIQVVFTESNKGVTTAKSSRYYWFHTRPILGQTKNGPKTPYSEALEKTQSRRLYLTRILPYSNNSF
jgi:hypothetical protein